MKMNLKKFSEISLVELHEAAADLESSRTEYTMLAP